MDRKLLNRHIASSTHEDINPVFESDGTNKSMFYCADVVGGRQFAQNYGGYPRSEIAELNEMTNIAQMQQLLSQMADYSPSDNPNAGKTDAEIMLGHKSKYMQTPSESIQWLEGQLHQRYIERQSKNPPSDSTISFSDNQNDAVENA